MEIIAQTNSVRISTRKVRLIVDTVRHMSVDNALVTLKMINKRGASVVEKTIRSAVANAVHNGKLDAQTLKIARIDVGEGQSLKRFHASTRGRIHPYKKRSSHIRVVLTEGGSK
jgi:large subunit ribosomal protein L22